MKNNFEDVVGVWGSVQRTGRTNKMIIACVGATVNRNIKRAFIFARTILKFTSKLRLGRLFIRRVYGHHLWQGLACTLCPYKDPPARVIVIGMLPHKNTAQSLVPV